ncbi:MAG: type II toxin-antitoxin system RatA family toxin [Gammaproteobacteria bacterium]|nr:type II toxin-antitoxin system RatA family toxin [Gammaproteobacteria bacterium]
MREYHRSATVPYAPESVFDLIADVDSYAEFVSGGTASCVEPAAPAHGDEHEVLATLAIVLGAQAGRFTTRNRLEPPHRIRMSLVTGPFSTLEGEWRVEPLTDGGSRLELDMRFKFASRLKDMLLGPVFEVTCGQLVNAFLKRARKLYG